MNKLLSQLTLPGNNGSVEISAPEGVPTGGLSGAGGQLVGWIISILLFSTVIIAFAFILYGGFLWITSQGDKAKLEGARKTIILAIVGLALAFLAFFIVGLFGQLFGIDLLNIQL